MQDPALARQAGYEEVLGTGDVAGKGGVLLEAGEFSDGFVRRAVAAAELGIEHLGVIAAGAWRPEALATLAAAIPQLREVHPPLPTAP